MIGPFTILDFSFGTNTKKFGGSPGIFRPIHLGLPGALCEVEDRKRSIGESASVTLTRCSRHIKRVFRPGQIWPRYKFDASGTQAAMHTRSPILRSTQSTVDIIFIYWQHRVTLIAICRNRCCTTCSVHSPQETHCQYVLPVGNTYCR